MFNKKIKKLATLFMCAVMTFSTVSVANAEYDGEAAAEYALKYAEDENPEYDLFEFDCTNFVSQCIYAGGISQTKNIIWSNVNFGVNNEKTRWYHRKEMKKTSFFFFTSEKEDWKISTTWVRVYNTGSGKGLYQYLVETRGCQIAAFVKNSKLTKFEKIVQIAEVGDIIQCKKGNNDLSHSVIVTGKENNDLRVCYHSEERRDVSFKDYIWKNYDTVYIIKVK